MALGLNYESNSGDIIPIVKFDAKAGRMFRIDRHDGTNTPTDITRSFKAVVDMENVEVGYMNFNTGGAPQFALAPLGSPMPAKPHEDFKQGVRLMMKLGKDCGGDVREISTVAKAALRGINALHDAYEAGKGQNAGKLPIVALKDTTPITTGEGARKSTNYEPVFEIVGWAARPQDLVHKPKGKPANGTANGAAKPAQATPPATGGTRVDPPGAKPAAAPAPASVSEEDSEDFG